MTHNDLVQLHNDLKKNLGSYKGKLAYAINRNLGRIEKIVTALADTIKPSEDYSQKFDAPRIELCRKFSELDDSGKPRMDQLPNGAGKFVIKEQDREEFEAELSTLSAEQKDLIDEHQVKIDAFNKLMDEEAEIDFFTIDPDTADLDSLTGDLMALVMPFFKD